MLEKMLLRFLSKPYKWYGTVTLKFYGGKVTSCCPQDSTDLNELSSLSLTIDPEAERVTNINYKENPTMLIKHGAGNIKAQDGKLQSATEIKEEGKVKVSSLQPKPVPLTTLETELLTKINSKGDN